MNVSTFLTVADFTAGVFTEYGTSHTCVPADAADDATEAATVLPSTLNFATSYIELAPSMRVTFILLPRASITTALAAPIKGV